MGIVRLGFDAEHALAFGVDLQHQAPEADAQDRQIVLRCLERDLHDRSADSDGCRPPIPTHVVHLGAPSVGRARDTGVRESSGRGGVLDDLM